MPREDPEIGCWRRASLESVPETEWGENEEKPMSKERK